MNFGQSARATKLTQAQQWQPPVATETEEQARVRWEAEKKIDEVARLIPVVCITEDGGESLVDIPTVTVERPDGTFTPVPSARRTQSGFRPAARPTMKMPTPPSHRKTREGPPPLPGARAPIIVRDIKTAGGTILGMERPGTFEEIDPDNFDPTTGEPLNTDREVSSATSPAQEIELPSSDLTSVVEPLPTGGESLPQQTPAQNQAPRKATILGMPGPSKGPPARPQRRTVMPIADINDLGTGSHPPPPRPVRTFVGDPTIKDLAKSNEDSSSALMSEGTKAAEQDLLKTASGRPQQRGQQDSVEAVLELAQKEIESLPPADAKHGSSGPTVPSGPLAETHAPSPPPPRPVRSGSSAPTSKKPLRPPNQTAIENNVRSQKIPTPVPRPRLSPPPSPPPRISGMPEVPPPPDIDDQKTLVRVLKGPSRPAPAFPPSQRPKSRPPTMEEVNAKANILTLVMGISENTRDIIWLKEALVTLKEFLPSAEGRSRDLINQATGIAETKIKMLEENLEHKKSSSPPAPLPPTAPMNAIGPMPPFVPTNMAMAPTVLAPLQNDTVRWHESAVGMMGSIIVTLFCIGVAIVLIL